MSDVNEQEIARFQSQVAALGSRLQVDELDGAGQEQLIEELATVFEELRVAEEELVVQQELITSEQAPLLAQLGRYEGLFHRAPVPYLVTDTDGKVVEANAEAERLLERRGRSVVGSSLAMLVTADERRVLRRMASAAGRDGRAGRAAFTLGEELGEPARVTFHATPGESAKGEREVSWWLQPEPAAPDSSEDLPTLVGELLGRVGSEDVTETLSWLADRCRALMAASACGVLLRGSDETLQVAASSGQDMPAIELFQLQHEEGPCFDAVQTGGTVVIPRLAETAGRWPSFTPRALVTGTAAAAGVPLRIGERVVGALNVLYTTTDPPSLHDVSQLEMLARVTAFVAVHQRELAESHELSAQLQQALDSRVVIEQAKGILAERLGTDPAGAFETLRTYARAHRRSLRSLAEAIVAGSATAADDRS